VSRQTRPYPKHAQTTSRADHDAAMDAWDRGDDRTAIHRSLAGAKRADSFCEFDVRYCHDAGRGTRRNRVEAIRWYLRSYRHGFPFAALSIGRLLRKTGEARRSRAWLHRALSHGVGPAALELAAGYVESGRNLPTARKYLKRVLRSWDVSEDDQEQARALLARLRGGKA
jgi:TPR repeat protein